MEEIVAKIKQEVQELDRAIKASQFPLPKLNIMPGEELSALEQYQALAALARKELPAFKSENENILNKAKQFMREGKAAMEKAQSLVSCR